MKFLLKGLTITNFKGIRSMHVDFSDVTNIYGINASGKTTLKDSFLWAFFGKDSTDRKDFEIKTLDENNQPYHRLDHEVTVFLEADGQDITIRRCYREKWVKKRGSSDTEFAGHETNFFWNDVPCSEKEYNAKINGLVNENIFKLVTNTDYFNSLKWQDRRNVLLAMAGDISTEEIIRSIPNAQHEFTALINALNQKKSIDEFKKEIGAKKSKIKDELEVLPARIDEAQRSLDNQEPFDLKAKQTELEELLASLESIDTLLTNKNKAQKERMEQVGKLQDQKQQLMGKRRDIQYSIKDRMKDAKQARESVIADLRRDIRSKENEHAAINTQYSNKDREKKQLESEKTALVNQWKSVNAEQPQFDENNFKCPSCKRAFEGVNLEEKKAELEANFNKDKADRLTKITEKGNSVKESLEVITAELSNITREGEGLRAEINKMKADLSTLETDHQAKTVNEEQETEKAIAADPEYIAAGEEIARLDEEINAPQSTDVNGDLLDRKRDVMQQIDAIKKEINGHEFEERRRADTKKRVAELSDREKTLAQELADLEGIEFSIQQFTKAKMDTLEKRINGMFKIVRFKMFEEQINGGQVEACTTLINGVPYADANTASKVQAGLDIINAISNYHDVKAPVWIDNRESVISIPETDSQIINLIVSPKDKKLRIEQAESSMAAA